MSVNDWKKKLLGFFSKVTTDGSHRPDGGTSCYRPIRRKSAEPPLREMDDSGSNQPVPYVHTGFTGMNPPVGGPAFPGPAYSQSAQQPPVQQPSGMMSPSSSYTPHPVSSGNISYMPGYSPDAGSSYTHVEHIIALTGLRSCYEAIECMKNGETLIVTLDAIANESESLRCQDMLAGAAFTLGCHVRMLQGARLVLIVPDGVQILPEEQPARQAAAPAPAPFAPPSSPPEGYVGRRERRTGNNPNWTAAQNGDLNNYNPYTGSMPVAAGSYSAFGGYGY